MENNEPVPDKFNDKFVQNLLKLELFLNFYLNKVNLSNDEFNHIFIVAKKLLVKEMLIRPFSRMSFENYFEKIDVFFQNNFDIKTAVFKKKNILYINFCISLLYEILQIKEYLNKNRDQELLKIKLKFGYLIKSISESDLIIHSKQAQKDILLNNVFNIDFKIHISDNSINYQEKIRYIFENIKKIFNNLPVRSKRNTGYYVHVLDYSNILSYNNTIIAHIDTLLKSELDLSRLLVVCFLVLKIIDNLITIIKDLFRF